MSTVEQAVAKFNEGKAALLGSNGQPRFVPDEHGRQMAALQATLQSAVDSEVTTAESAIQTTQAKIVAIQARSPLDALSQAELQRANERAQFVKEDLSSMPLDALAGRLKTMLAGEDKADLFLFVRYLPSRIEAENKTARSEPIRAMLRELIALHRQAGEVLTPSGEAEVKKLRADIEAAQLRRARALTAARDATQQRRRLVTL